MKALNIVAMTFVCLLLGVIVSWQFQSISSAAKASQIENMRMEELRDSLIMEQNNNAILRAKIASLQADIEAYKNIQGDSTVISDAVRQELLQARMVAGLTNVKGTGMIITMNGDSTVYLDYDILLILNELRASDVQAISINGQRVTATTEVRRAGSFLMVNNTQIMLPVEIRAIADPVELENALNITGGVIETLKNTWNITMKRADDLFIPKVPDDGTVIKTDLLTPVD